MAGGVVTGGVVPGSVGVGSTVMVALEEAESVCTGEASAYRRSAYVGFPLLTGASLRTAQAVKRRLHETKRTGSSVVLRNRCGTPESNPNESPARTTYESKPYVISSSPSMTSPNS